MLSVDAQRLLLSDNARIAAISTGNVPTGVVLRVGQEIHETHDPIQFDSSWGHTPRLLQYSDDAALYYGGAIEKFGNNGDLRTVLGKIYTVQETDGITAGANLFHSFARFSVGAGDAVVFTTNTYSLQNVIARVTGGAASVIDGLLMLDPVPGSRPNFFLINPSGIAFGAGAVVDMPAAFHASTASRLIFGHDAMLVAGAPDSVSIASEPSAFGFVGGEAGIAMRYVINGGLAAPLPFFLGAPESSPFATSYFDLTGPSIHITDSKFSSRNEPLFALRMIGAGPGSATIPVVGAAEVHAHGKVSVENSDFGWILGDFNRSEIHVGDNSGGQLEAGVIAISSVQGSTQPAIELYGPSIHASNVSIESYGSFIQPGDPTQPQASRILLSGDLVELRNTGWELMDCPVLGWVQPSKSAPANCWDLGCRSASALGLAQRRQP